MEKLIFSLPLNRKKPPKYSWQEKALEIIKAMSDGNKYKPSIFRCCKTNLRNAEIAFIDCQELGKLHCKYFFKVYAEISKK